MNRGLRYRRIVLSSLVILTLLGIGSAHAEGKRPTAENKMDEILERLARIETQLAQTRAADREAQQLAKLASASATFCITQGLGLELAGKYAVENKVEFDLGAGWPNVLQVKGSDKLNVPFLLPVPSLMIPVPIPTEAALQLVGGRGRNFDVCVEIPLRLSETDQDLLKEIALVMNDDSNLGDGTFLSKGKLQKRGARVVNFACRKVAGILNCPVLPNLTRNAADLLQVNAQDDELERADSAAESLLDGGLGAVQEGLDAFRDGNVSELLASLELPSSVRAHMQDPERIFAGLPDLSEQRVNCAQLQITASMRGRLPRLDRLCATLEDLPDFGVVKSASDTIDALSDEVVDAIAELVGPLLGSVGEAPQTTKDRFCSSNIGQRRVFDRYCGR